MLEYQKQDCDLTLEEGLECYYRSFPDTTEVFKDDNKTQTIDSGVAVFSRFDGRYEFNSILLQVRGFGRIDQRDENRGFIAAEDAYIEFDADIWRFLFGYRLYNWSATEAFHPADIINSRNWDSDIEKS